ncbi:hypothetical protein NDU88_002292 [Pleurodeles waltl]|uniref:Uncharacterized protein n=1 Tax=Pleurodeles waltl TaxID=8319 RepID=A0AAV7VC26_PLEWA|nr:hypothetical protein NDU88_002292 [Pleurodeles waltl]
MPLATPPVFQLKFTDSRVRGIAPRCAAQPRPLDSLRVPTDFHSGLGLPCGAKCGPSSSPTDSSDTRSTERPWRHYCSPCGIRSSDSVEPYYTIAGSVEALRAQSELLQM